MFRQLAILLTAHLALSHAFTIQPKIFDGVLSDTTKHPYFAMLSDGEPGCSASLISDSWIITASHCLEFEIPLNVSLGIRQDGTYETTVEVAVADQFMYPGFFKHRIFDIALIKLAHPLELGQSIQPVQLPQSCDGLHENEAVDGLGIGYYSNGPIEPIADGKLREGSFNTTDCYACEALRSAVPDTQSVICTAYSAAQAMAFGDSGGPLIRHKDGVQVGIHKGLFQKFGMPQPLGIFTRISYFFDWISSVTGLDLPSCTNQAQAIFE